MAGAVVQAGESIISLGRTAANAPKHAGRGSWGALFAFSIILLATNVATGLALFFAPEITTLFKDDNSSLITAYEQRITQLRIEVDRLHSRQYAQMGDMNLQMHDLVQQQEMLFEQHEYVRALTEMAREIGVANTAPLADREARTGSIAFPAATDDPAALAESLSVMQDETRLALVSLSDAAVLSTNEIIAELRPIGIQTGAATVGTGGPFIPADTGSDSIIAEANAVAAALAEYQLARKSLLDAPVRTPIAGHPAVSSNFGNRTDPFLNRPAFHAGMDFRAATGTPVLSAANGTVTFAGTNGGYGQMVDVDHGNGLITRYAHLSRLFVSKGQTISGGEQIGLAGSTGRSTGPHLHFEVRRNGAAIDPGRFIDAGRNLARYLR